MRYLNLISICICFPLCATSFPGSLILPPPGAPGGGKMRDPRNEVALCVAPKLIRSYKENQMVKAETRQALIDPCLPYLSG